MSGDGVGSQDQHRKPDLFAAIGARLTEQQQEHDEATRPEREAREARLEGDAKLHGTAGWTALSDARRRMAAAHVARQAQGGGNDAA